MCRGSMSEELVQGVAAGFAVRGGVDGGIVGAVSCDFEFVFCDFIPVFGVSTVLLWEGIVW